jgi:hypothetical protein
MLDRTNACGQADGVGASLEVIFWRQADWRCEYWIVDGAPVLRLYHWNALKVECPVAGAAEALGTMRDWRNSIAPNPASRWTSEIPERRSRARQPINGGAPARGQLTSQITGGYREMPGLSLDLPQAARLFALDPVTCRVVLDDLVQKGSLVRSSDGRYRSHP